MLHDCRREHRSACIVPRTHSQSLLVFQCASPRRDDELCRRCDSCAPWFLEHGFGATATHTHTARGVRYSRTRSRPPPRHTRHSIRVRNGRLFPAPRRNEGGASCSARALPARAPAAFMTDVGGIIITAASKSSRHARVEPTAHRGARLTIDGRACSVDASVDVHVAEVKRWWRVLGERHLAVVVRGPGARRVLEIATGSMTEPVRALAKSSYGAPRSPVVLRGAAVAAAAVDHARHLRETGRRGAALAEPQCAPTSSRRAWEKSQSAARSRCDPRWRASFKLT